MVSAKLALVSATCWAAVPNLVGFRSSLRLFPPRLGAVRPNSGRLRPILGHFDQVWRCVDQSLGHVGPSFVQIRGRVCQLGVCLTKFGACPANLGPIRPKSRRFVPNGRHGTLENWPTPPNQRARGANAIPAPRDTSRPRVCNTLLPPPGNPSSPGEGPCLQARHSKCTPGASVGPRQCPILSILSRNPSA